jgi:crossover junction endodeoxyribonuclease RusA
MMVELGWPHKALSPNHRSRSHWPRTRALAKAKQEGWGAALAAIGKAPFQHSGQRLKVVLTAYPPDRHARDSDNLLASAKGHLDGIAKALGVDDSLFDPRVQWAEPVKHGRIVVTIAEVA